MVLFVGLFLWLQWQSQHPIRIPSSCWTGRHPLSQLQSRGKEVSSLKVDQVDLALEDCTISKGEICPDPVRINPREHGRGNSLCVMEL